jgi:hypothetical protein
MDFLRHVSRHPASVLCVDLSPGARRGSGGRKAHGQPLDRCPLKHGRDVHGDDVDATGLDASRMGLVRGNFGPATTSESSLNANLPIGDGSEVQNANREIGVLRFQP